MTITTTFIGAGVAPSTTSATMTGNVVRLTFSEPMEVSEVTNKSNYSISGVTIISVEIAPQTNDSAVLITISNFQNSTSYTVVVKNVHDKAGNLIA